MTLALITGCATPRPVIDVSLAGAQISLELIESWLRDSHDVRFRVERVSPVFVSQDGFQALGRGDCDIACTDRPLTSRERAQITAPVEGARIAFYGYALYVHPDNPLDSIFAGHLSLLFQHKITDWNQLFRRDDLEFAGPIRLIGPEKSTRGGEILMRQARIWFDSPTWQALDSDAQIINAVANDPLALGFAAVGYHDGVRPLGLRMSRNDPPAFPSLEEIESQRYGLAKVIYIYWTAPATPTAEAVRAYLFSQRARQAMAATKVWQIAEERAALP